jgi:glutamate 5-kinase
MTRSIVATAITALVTRASWCQRASSRVAASVWCSSGAIRVGRDRLVLQQHAETVDGVVLVAIVGDERHDGELDRSCLVHDVTPGNHVVLVEL